MKKFIIVNKGGETGNVGYSTPRFFEAFLQISAFKRGFDVFALGFNSVVMVDGEVYCRVCRLSFQNVDLLEKLLTNLELIEKIEEISQKESGKKHNLKTNPLTLFRINELLQSGNKELISLLEKFAEENNVEFKPQEGVLTLGETKQVLMEHFCEDNKDNVLYLRYANNKNTPFSRLQCFAEIEKRAKILFPVRTANYRFNDKTIVVEDENLRPFSLPIKKTSIKIDGDRANLIKEIKEFYQEHCRSEGLVIKPENGGAGNGIVFLSPGISEEKLEEEISKKLQKSQEEHFGIYGLAVPYGSIILQQRVHSLTPKHPELPTGDVRVTIIDGEIFGFGMRYGEEDQALSYCPAKNILPNSMPFTKENIEALISENSQDSVKKQYYENLLAVFETSCKVANWCAKNNYFHIGMDILVGTDSEGKYTFCLTEMNNITVDGVLKLILINKEVKADSRYINISDTILDNILKGKKPPAITHPTNTSESSASMTSAKLI